MAPNQRIAIAEDRSRIYWLLSRFFLAPPDAQFLAELGAVPVVPVADADELGAALAQLREGLAGLSAADLQAEHLRLFGGVREGNGPPPPYESLHREGRLLGESTEAVMAHYRGSGMSLAGEGAGPEDHLGLELKFLALLCHQESRHWRDGDEAGGREALAAQQAFIEQHLQAWAPEYCATLKAEARSPFYQAVAELTATSIVLDAGQVAELLGELPRAGADRNIQGGLQ
jgi:TorA maturation chaperone TorD